MASAKDVPLSVAQVAAMTPGDEQNATWINPGVTGSVASISKKKSKTGKQFWACELQDMTGPQILPFTLFVAPRFSEGDVIDIHGKGLRLGEYNGKAVIQLGRDTEISVIGQSAHHKEQTERRESGAPAVNGQPQHVNGQTVGMAVKEAIALVRSCQPGSFDFTSVKFWQDVRQVASSIIRLSHALEHGKLAPSIGGNRATPETGNEPGATQTPPQPAQARSVAQTGRADPPQQAAKPKPGPDGSSVDTSGAEEDVPF